MLLAGGLIVVAIAVAAWFALQWMFGWEPGIGLMAASLVAAGFAYGGLETLVVWIRERRDPKP